MDGISWKFVHVPDSFGKKLDRNVKGLRGHIADTAPFRWSGYDRTLEGFIREEVAGLLHGPKLPESQIQALAGYVESLALLPNPFRPEDGSLTPAGARGKALFEGRAACSQCHAGPKAGGGRSAWIGTTPHGVMLEVPHLAGVYDTDPYLHDGRARTLEEIFDRYDPGKLHGKAQTLSPDERKDLLEYVREL